MLALEVVMPDEDLQVALRAGSLAEAEHVDIAAGTDVADCQDRRHADALVDAECFHRSVVECMHAGEAAQHRFAVFIAQRGDHAAADHVIAGDSVSLARQDAGDVGAAGRDDEVVEAVGAQISGQLAHRYVGKPCPRLLEAWMPGVADELAGLAAEIILCAARIGDGQQLEHRVIRCFLEVLAVQFQCGHEGHLRAPFRVLCRAVTQSLESEEALWAGLFRPQRAIVVEHGDAFCRGDIAGAAGGADVTHEIENALLARPVTPGGQRVGRSLTQRGKAETGEQQQYAREHGSPRDVVQCT